MPARQLAAVAATAALVTSTALVATTITPADAASVKTQYTCDTALGTQTMNVTTKLSLPSKVKSGRAVADRPVRMNVVLPAALVDGIRGLGITALSGAVTDAKYRVGSKKVPLRKVKIVRTDVPASGPMPLKAGGTAKGFTLRKPGKYAVKVPKTFTVNALNQDDDALPPIPCALVSGAPAKISTIKVVR